MDESLKVLMDGCSAQCTTFLGRATFVGEGVICTRRRLDFKDCGDCVGGDFEDDDEDDEDDDEDVRRDASGDCGGDCAGDLDGDSEEDSDGDGVGDAGGDGGGESDRDSDGDVGGDGDGDGDGDGGGDGDGDGKGIGSLIFWALGLDFPVCAGGVTEALTFLLSFCDGAFAVNGGGRTKGNFFVMGSSSCASTFAFPPSSTLTFTISPFLIPSSFGISPRLRISTCGR